MIKYIIVMSAILISISGLYAIHAIASPPPNNITKLFGNTSDYFRTDYLHLPEAAAELHGNWTLAGKIDQERSVLDCINHVFLVRDQQHDPNTLQVCDDVATGNVRDNTFADNQTMVKLEHAYLTARISSLPAPPNPLQCQETSGQILACSYATQNLSNGEQIVVITVYVPANFVFSGGGAVNVVKVLVHKTTTKIIPERPGPYTVSVTIKVGTDPIVRGHIETITVTVTDNSKHGTKIVGAKVSGEFLYASGSHKPISCTTTNQNGESQCSSIIGPNSIPGTFKITVQVSASGYKPAAKSATFTVIPKTNTTSITNATIPINVTNPTSTNITTSPTGTNDTTVGNSSAGTSSGGPTGKGGGSNGKQAIQGPQLLPQLTTPTVDCNANPSDPSCPQQPPPSTTKTCPDGSQPGANGNCPTTHQQPTPPGGDHHDHHGSKHKKSTNGGNGETSPSSPGSP